MLKLLKQILNDKEQDLKRYASSCSDATRPWRWIILILLCAVIWAVVANASSECQDWPVTLTDPLTESCKEPAQEGSLRKANDAYLEDQPTALLRTWEAWFNVRVNGEVREAR